MRKTFDQLDMYTIQYKIMRDSTYPQVNENQINGSDVIEDFSSDDHFF